MEWCLIKSVRSGYNRRTKSGKLVWVAPHYLHRTTTTKKKFGEHLARMKDIYKQAGLDRGGITKEHKTEYATLYANAKILLVGGASNLDVLSAKYGSRIPSPSEIEEGITDKDYLQILI